MGRLGITGWLLSIAASVFSQYSGNMTYVSDTTDLEVDEYVSDLSYFRARNKYKREVIIDWGISDDNDNDFFVLEKSSNLKSWFRIALIEASEKQNQNNSYSYTHVQEEGGDMYYRLSKVSSDGFVTTFYKAIASARIESKSDIKQAMMYGEWYELVAKSLDKYEKGLFMVRYKNRVYKIYR